jgi:hypothetical protein
LLAQKVVLENAKEIATPFNTPVILTLEGLTSYLEAIEIDAFGTKKIQRLL